ncbi:MAG: reprolysin-like metallopeptidase [Bacteroidota bacterium]
MRVVSTLLCALFLSLGLSAQTINNFWSAAQESDIVLPRGTERAIIPEHYHTARLDIDNLRATLRRAPAERSTEASNSPMRITLPMPDGRLELFEVVDAPVMRPALAAKFPNIRTFIGKGVTSKGAYARLGYGNGGFHAAIFTRKGEVFIDPYAKNQEEYYISYYTRDHKMEGAPTRCGVHDEEIKASPLQGIEFNEEIETHSDQQFNLRGSEPVELLVYDMALACVGEFGARYDSDEEVMEDFNLAMSRVNMFYEQEVAIRFLLVENNDLLIFRDPATDDYTNVTNGGGLLQQNRLVLDGIIGNANYDIGHVFTIGCGGGLAGVASGSACTNNKGRGVTCFPSVNILGRVLNTMTHEIGHQFSASHTWDNCPGILEQRAGGSAVEPGSGSTIMSYLGACGNQNLSGPDGRYFSVESIDQMFRYSRSARGADCPDIEATSNNTPDVILPYDDDFYIPINTPFELTAIATDPEDEGNLTYCWEQHNTGPISPLGSPFGSAPAFRSYDPTSNPTRVFPLMNNIINNRLLEDPENVLPTYNRALDFRCTVRDNNPEVGGTVWEEVTFNATESAGPFRVSSPNTAVTYEVGDYVEVTWDVANTDNNLVNCQNVNIKLSVDGGFNSNIMLAESVPNDGSHFIIIPDNITNDARVRIEAADNIFFDLSNTNFRIIAPSAPGYSLDVTPFSQQVCLPDAAIIDLNTGSLLGYDSLISFTINGLPANAVPLFSNNPALPTEGSELTIDMSEVIEEGIFTLELVAIAPNADTSYRNINLELVNSDFSLVEQLTPEDGANGESELPEFSWNGSPFADSYEIEIATSPTFEASTVIDFTSNLTETTYTPTILLEKSTPYFWRVRAVNACGPGEYLPTYAFHTETLSCANYTSTNVPVIISAQGTPTVESTISVFPGGTISDLNVTKVKGQHDLVKHIDVSLVSPDAKEVLLFSDKCGNTQLFDLGLDDQGPSEIPCPPTGGQAHRPDEPLSAFNGDNSEGTWTLKIEVVDALGEGGGLTDWGLQICASVSLSPPRLINNEILGVRPGEGNFITTNFLLSEDDDNTAEELTYTVVSYPEHGRLTFNGGTIGLGAQFTQRDIDVNLVRYEHDGDTARTDFFTFTVSDGEGGWLGVPRYEIDIDDDNITSTSEIEASNLFVVYPNPAQNQLTVLFNEQPQEAMQLSIVDLQGRVLLNQRYARPDAALLLNTSQLANGIYFLRLESATSAVTKKVSIQRR